MVKLDVAGPAPSIELVRLGEAGLPPDADFSRQFQSQRRYKIDLKNKAKGFYLTIVKKGTYQITTINAPFFGLPYRVNTQNSRIWRFSIEEDSLNYIGNFHLAAERQTQSVDTRLINRIASELTAILKLKDQLPERLPLRSGPGYRDDFLTTLEAATRSTQ